MSPSKTGKLRPDKGESIFWTFGSDGKKCPHCKKRIDVSIEVMLTKITAKKLRVVPKVHA